LAATTLAPVLAIFVAAFASLVAAICFNSTAHAEEDQQSKYDYNQEGCFHLCKVALATQAKAGYLSITLPYAVIIMLMRSMDCCAVTIWFYTDGSIDCLLSDSQLFNGQNCD